MPVEKQRREHPDYLLQVENVKELLQVTILADLGHQPPVRAVEAVALRAIVRKHLG